MLPSAKSTTVALKALLRRAVGSSIFVGGGVSLVLIFAASVSGFVMFALAARQMEPHSFGSLVVIFNAMGFLGVAVVFGQESLISRSWGEYCETNRPALARGALAFGMTIATVGGAVGALLCLCLWLQFGTYESAWIPVAASLFLLAEALVTFFSRFALVAGNVVVAVLPRDIPWRLAIIALILCGSYVGMHLNVATFFFVAAAAMGLSLLCQGWRVWQLVPDSVKNASAEFDVANWRLRSSRMWLSSLLDASGQYLEVIVIGIVLGPSTAAYYFSATRITNVFAMIAGAMTIYATRHISPLYHGRTTEELRDFLSSLAILSLLLGLGAFIVIMLGGKLLLSLFGPSYTDVYPALLILAVGGSLTAMAGPAPYLLLLTGHDGLYPWIVAGTLAVRIGLIVILGYWLGLIGAAIAGSLGAAATAVALVVACRWVLGVDPSVLAAVRRIPLGANRKDEGPREGA